MTGQFFSFHVPLEAFELRAPPHNGAAGCLPAAGGKHRWKPFFRTEIFFRKRAGVTTVGGVVCVDFFDACECLRQRREAQQPATRGDTGAESRLFGQHRAAAGQVGHAAVAEPAAVELFVKGFRATKFRARSLDVSLILDRRSGDPVGVDQAPSGAEQELAIAGLFARINIGGELEGRLFGGCRDRSSKRGAWKSSEAPAHPSTRSPARR